MLGKDINKERTQVKTFWLAGDRIFLYLIWQREAQRQKVCREGSEKEIWVLDISFKNCLNLVFYPLLCSILGQSQLAQTRWYEATGTKNKRRPYFPIWPKFYVIVQNSKLSPTSIIRPTKTPHRIHRTRTQVRHTSGTSHPVGYFSSNLICIQFSYFLRGSRPLFSAERIFIRMG